MMNKKDSGCTRRKVLTVAGSDCSGGAGIQADLKTMAAHGIYGMSVITAITAQNTLGVIKAGSLATELVAAQFDAVFTDIMPDAVKTGMLATAGVADIVASKLKEYNAVNIVVDPVLVATSGSRLSETSVTDVLVNKLLPLAKLATPNIPEAEVMADASIHDREDMISVAAKLCKSCGTSVLLKGGHISGDADDLLYCTEEEAALIDKDSLDGSTAAAFEEGQGGRAVWFYGERICTRNTHGTGCTLSSAIACNLAAGLKLVPAIAYAKEYLSGALKAGLDIGKGNGPVDHCFRDKCGKMS